MDSVIEVQVKDYAASNWGFNEDTIQIIFNTIHQQWNFPSTQFPRLDSLGNDLYVTGNISSQANSYIQQMYSFANQWLNVASPNVLAYNSFANHIISLEGQINNNNIISTNEKSILLSACSGARYSAAYWANHINGQTYPSVKNSITHFNSSLSPAPWLGIVLADVEGFTEFLSESPLPPAWRIAGAIIAGVASSVIFAVNEL